MQRWVLPRSQKIQEMTHTLKVDRIGDEVVRSRRQAREDFVQVITDGLSLSGLKERAMTVLHTACRQPRMFLLRHSRRETRTM